jgi:hypothetical protein
MGCRKERRGGSGGNWAAHSPYAPSMLGVINAILCWFQQERFGGRSPNERCSNWVATLFQSLVSLGWDRGRLDAVLQIAGSMPIAWGAVWRPAVAAGRRSIEAGTSPAPDGKPTRPNDAAIGLRSVKRRETSQTGPTEPESPEWRCTGSPRINDQRSLMVNSGGKETATWKLACSSTAAGLPRGGAGLDRQ